MAARETAEARFTPELYTFLRELAKNNNREWFLKNKERYHRVVVEPCLAFIRDVGPGISHLSKFLLADDRPTGGSLYRIYRDLRFSKDKTPYKTTVGIHFYHVGTGASGGNYPGFHFHLGPQENFAGGGLWGPDAAALKAIRQRIAAEPSQWKKARIAPLSDWGDALKRVPPGFDADHPFAEDLRHKDFTIGLPLTEAQVLGPKIVPLFLAQCAKLDPFNRFLAKAVGVEY